MPTQDAFFASAAVEVFDAVSSGDFKPVPFATAIVQAVDENRVYFHSFDEGVEAAFDGSRLSGPLPRERRSRSDDARCVRQRLTEGKLSFYTWMSADVVADRCSAVPTYTTTVTFVNALDQATSDGLVKLRRRRTALPQGHHWNRHTVSRPQRFALRQGDDRRNRRRDHQRRTPRSPVGRMWVVNGLQQAHTLTMTCRGAPEDGGEVSLVHTPVGESGANQRDRDRLRVELASHGRGSSRRPAGVPSEDWRTGRRNREEPRGSRVPRWARERRRNPVGG